MKILVYEPNKSTNGKIKAYLENEKLKQDIMIEVTDKIETMLSLNGELKLEFINNFDRIVLRVNDEYSCLLFLLLDNNCRNLELLAMSNAAYRDKLNNFDNILWLPSTLGKMFDFITRPKIETTNHSIIGRIINKFKR